MKGVLNALAGNAIHQVQFGERVPHKSYSVGVVAALHCTARVGGGLWQRQNNVTQPAKSFIPEARYRSEQPENNKATKRDNASYTTLLKDITNGCIKTCRSPAAFNCAFIEVFSTQLLFLHMEGI